MLNAIKETKPLINFARIYSTRFVHVKSDDIKIPRYLKAVDIIYIVVEDWYCWSHFASQFPITVYKHTFGFLEIQS